MSSYSHFYRLIISYEGTSYFGWQVQSETSETVQGKLNEALETVFKTKVQTVGSGRTDRGVHALGQVVKVSAPFDIQPNSLMMATNSLLPDDIRVLNVEVCSSDFRPVQDALWKEYIYIFAEKDICRPPFHRNFVASSPNGLDYELMQDAVSHFVGEWDFKAFQCVGTPVSTTVRTIKRAELSRVSGDDFLGTLSHESYWMFRFVGNGFLKQMVRQMVGAIWKIGQGRATIQDLESALKAESSEKIGVTAPGNGLYLSTVTY